MWNTYRKTHVKMLDVGYRARLWLNDKDGAQSLQDQAQVLAEALISSIPFHLCSDLSTYLLPNNDVEAIHPGKPVGGLLLLYPLWVMATSPILSAEIRRRLRECLAWIGRNMGIGQASLLANVSRAA